MISISFSCKIDKVSKFGIFLVFHVASQYLEMTSHIDVVLSSSLGNHASYKYGKFDQNSYMLRSKLSNYKTKHLGCLPGKEYN